MTPITHHLTDKLLMGHAAGALPEAFDLLVATHVSLCDDCRARLAEFEAVGGAVLTEAGAEPVAEDSLAATLARIAAADPTPRKPVERSGPHDPAALFPAPLRAYAGGDSDAVRWRSIGGGVRQAVLHADRTASIRLLRIPGGVAVPDHGHSGTELTLVLQGAFRDETDRFAPGDVEVADASLTHTPVAESGEDCICLAATEGRLRFSSLLPRIAGRLMGI